MSRVVLLDAGPLGMLARPGGFTRGPDCSLWLAGLLSAGVRAIVPEIADYEVRRELIRIGSVRGIAQLDAVGQNAEYLALTTAAMRRAADLWAQARQAGQPTAGDKNLDADMILIAQALTCGDPNFVIATTNVRHLARFAPADVWENIIP